MEPEELLARALGSESPEAELFAPAFLRRFPMRIVEQTARMFLAEHGPLVRVERDGERWRAVYENGTEPVKAVLTPEGRIRGLLVGPNAGDVEPWDEPPSRASVLRRRFALAVLLAAGMPLLAVAAVWSADSLATWLPLSVLAAGMLVESAVFLPWWAIAPRVRLPFVAACALASAASAERLRDLRAGHVVWWLVAVVAVGLAPVVLRLRASREGRPLPEPVRLFFPLAGGVYCVAQGGGASVNPHAGSPEQRYALDVVRSRGLVGRCSPPALYPAALERYDAWDTEVVAPCDGVVAAVADGVPDLPPPAWTPLEPAGNHVLLETDGARVLLAHLRAGTVAVSEGDAVRRGDPVGRVGNSGRSTEPHLHVHAERGGFGVPLAFEEAGGRPLRRNDVLRIPPGRAG